MIESIKSLELKGSIELDKIFQMFSSISPEISTKFQSNFSQFQTTNEFFNYYTNKDINYYLSELNNLNINLSLICDNYYPSNSSYTEKKISVISKIFLLSGLIINIQRNLDDQLLSIKKYLSNLFHSNEFVNEQNTYKNLINLIENITIIQNKQNSKKKRNSRKSVGDNLLIRDISIKNISNYSFSHKNNKNLSIKNIDYEQNNNQSTGEQTPSFHVKNLMIKNTKSLNMNRIISKENGAAPPKDPKEVSKDVIIQKGSQFSVTDLIFVVENSKKNIINLKKNNENGIIDLLLDKKQKKSQGDTIPISKNNIQQSRCHSGDYKHLVNKFGKTKAYGYLLEIIQKSYNSCYINAEEKFKLKQLIISKPKLVEEIYTTFFKPGNSEKSKIIDYLKNYL